MLDNGRQNTASGVYNINFGNEVKPVYCDMNTAGGGWTVIQRRGDFGNPQDYFLRNWTEYKNGFGDLKEDHWLGLEKIHQLGIGKQQELLIELEDFEGNKTSVILIDFQVGDEQSNYPLIYTNYTNSHGQSLLKSGLQFSTIDRDNDQKSSMNCAQEYSGAWWYKNCHQANINGLYLRGPHTTFANGVNWKSFRGHYYSLKNTEMKVRAV